MLSLLVLMLPVEPPYTLDAPIDASILFLGLGSTASQWVPTPPPSCLPDCVAPDVNAFDRWALGRYEPSFRLTADIGMTALAVAPVALSLIDTHGQDGWGGEMVVYAESLFLAQGIAQIAKHLIDRNAPFTYENYLTYGERDGAAGTFPSGHTALAVAAATTYSVSYWMRHPDDPKRFAILAVSEVLALGVGLFKILAGSHYPTDVLGGALIGALCGILVPLGHAQ